MKDREMEGCRVSYTYSLLESNKLHFLHLLPHLQIDFRSLPPFPLPLSRPSLLLPGLQGGKTQPGIASSVGDESTPHTHLPVDYRRLQRITEDYRELQERLQKITENYKTLKKEGCSSVCFTPLTLE